MVTCPDMLDCLLIKAGIIPQEDATLLELEPVDLGRRDSNTAYLDVSTTDSIIKVVAEFAKRDKRTVRRCLSDKLRHLRCANNDIYKLRVLRDGDECSAVVCEPTLRYGVIGAETYHETKCELINNCKLAIKVSMSDDKLFIGFRVNALEGS
ncbi:hypothetical protein ACHWQZ_G016830 [Mnemiopsis leidyi]